jgi:uncharacterized protein (TIGR03382 family)
MHTTTTTLFAGIATLGAAMGAVADYQFVFLDYVEGSTYRLYAQLEEGDSVNAVYGDGDDELHIEATTGFYQNAFGGPTSKEINPALYSVFPSLEFDSWVTIGLEDMNDNALNTIGIDFTSFEAGGGITTDDGAWFTTPDDQQSYAGADGSVLLGQFTFLDDGWFSNLSFCMQGKTADGATWSDCYEMPAPGAMALLGMAGVFGGRRRRRR